MILHFLTIPGMPERWLAVMNLPDHPLYHPALKTEILSSLKDSMNLKGENYF